jgi:hypothetical protein
MQKWDYLVARPDVTEPDELQLFLSLRGEEGWELVSVTSQKFGEGHGEHSFTQYTVFFKRPLK